MGCGGANCNATWTLTEYTKDNGALAYVPGSHRSQQPYPGPGSADLAIPVECPKGSVIIWHGATWHGAYPRLNPGVRLAVTPYYCHRVITTQEQLFATTTQEEIEACDDPETFARLTWQHDSEPYIGRQTENPIPRARK